MFCLKAAVHISKNELKYLHKWLPKIRNLNFSYHLSFSLCSSIARLTQSAEKNNLEHIFPIISLYVYQCKVVHSIRHRKERTCTNRKKNRIINFFNPHSTLVLPTWDESWDKRLNYGARMYIKPVHLNL